MELPTHRLSLYNKLTPLAPAGATQRSTSLNRRMSKGGNTPLRVETSLPRETSTSTSTSVPPQAGRSSATATTSPFYRKPPYASQQQAGLHPVLESVNHAVKNTDLRDIQLPEPMTTDDFTRAVAVATVSALRHQQQSRAHSPGRVRSGAEHDTSAGGHDAPSWSRTTSASVLLGCTALYAVIAGMCFDPSSLVCVRNIYSSVFFFFFL